ncbi:MAG: hypothetical protein M0Z84_11785 [Gammaproteobacteria bacterium]|nr:hypothetical protein [Gammaproteobacteria bacterium]
MFHSMSRRRWLRAAAFAVSGATLYPLLRRSAHAAPAVHKVTPASVHYRIVMGPNQGKHCGMCRYSIPDRARGMGGMCAGGTCKLVSGPISAMGYCLLFKPT